MVDPTPIRDRYAALLPPLDERGRRRFAASEARAAGHGGIAATARATGIARSTIGRGLKDLADGSDLPAGRVRRPGGGRKPLTEVDAKLLDDLLGLVSPSERGDSMSPLRWTCKSLRRLAAELGDLGHQISHTVVGELYRPRLVRHRIACYAARAAGESWLCRTAAGVWNPCRSMSQVVL